MKKALLLLAFLSLSSLYAEEATDVNTPQETEPATNATFVCNQPQSTCNCQKHDTQNMVPAAEKEEELSPTNDVRISVIGQGVAPMNTTSPAQAYALAKRAAIADAYRMVAEKVKGVRVEGQDLIKNMMVKRSTVRTYVDAMVREANIVETNFQEGLCEVEMEIVLKHSQFAN